jgi:hypothetical protein
MGGGKVGKGDNCAADIIVDAPIRENTRCVMAIPSDIVDVAINGHQRAKNRAHIILKFGIGDTGNNVI